MIGRFNKKFLLILLIIVTFGALTGCSNKELKKTSKNVNNTNSNTETTNNNYKVKVNDVEVELDYKGSLDEMFYRYPSKAVSSNVGTYSIMDYMNNSEFVFRILIAKFDNTSVDEAMQNSIIKGVGTKNINDITWNIYEGMQDDGKKTISYACAHDKDTYSITFVFDDDINSLINLFMNTVGFD